MTSSKRWLESDSDADEAERAILRAGLGATSPPPQLEDEVLKRVLAVALAPAPIDPGASGAGVGPAAPLPAATAASAAATTTKAVSTLTLLGKGFIAGVGVSVAVAAGQHWSAGESPRTDASESAPALERRAPPKVAVVAPRMRAPVTPAPTAAASSPPLDVSESKGNVRPLPRSVEASRSDVPPPVPEPAARARRASQLEQEAALLKAARQQLRQGSLAAAFATLETSRQRFSASELEQEREALMIELLYRSGQREAAAVRARGFLRRYPESPHRGQVQKFVE